MTLAELQELLRELPASAEIAPVLVGGYDLRDVRYERGVVRVETARPPARLDEDEFF